MYSRCGRTNLEVAAEASCKENGEDSGRGVYHVYFQHGERAHFVARFVTRVIRAAWDIRCHVRYQMSRGISEATRVMRVPTLSDARLLVIR